jgi:hypothetical protein
VGLRRKLLSRPADDFEKQHDIASPLLFTEENGSSLDEPAFF